jgi:hypothetical protein
MKKYDGYTHLVLFWAQIVHRLRRKYAGFPTPGTSQRTTTREEIKNLRRKKYKGFTIKNVDNTSYRS